VLARVRCRVVVQAFVIFVAQEIVIFVK